MKKNKGGRPSVMTKEVVAKLEQVFAIDGSVEEACSYADISRDAFYDYLKKEPKFSDRIAQLRETPVLKARQTVVKALSDPNHAFRYLEKKKKKEFGNVVDITSGGEKLNAFDNGQITKIAARVLNGDTTGKGKSS